MAKEAQTNEMPTFMGRGVGLGIYDQIDNLAWLPKIRAAIVDTTLVSSQSGSFFTTEGATEAEIEFTLPAVADGPWVFDFFNAEDINMKVSAHTAGELVVFNDVAGDSISYSTANEKIGGAFRVFCNGVKVYVQVMLGDHGQTVTIV